MKGPSGEIESTPSPSEPVDHPSDPLPYSTSSSRNTAADHGTDGDNTDGNTSSRGGDTSSGENAPRSVEEVTILPDNTKPMQSLSPKVQEKIKRNKAKNA